MKTEKGESSDSREMDLQSFETRTHRYEDPASATDQGQVSDILSDLSLELRRLGVRMASNTSEGDVLIVDDSGLWGDSFDSAENWEGKVDQSQGDLTAVIKSGDQSYSRLLAQAMKGKSPSLEDTERMDKSLVQLSDSPVKLSEDVKDRRSFSCSAKMLESQLLPYRNTTVFDSTDFYGTGIFFSSFADLSSEEDPSYSNYPSPANVTKCLDQNLPNDPLEVDLCALSHDESRQIDTKYTSRKLYCPVCKRAVNSVISLMEESPSL